MDDFLQKLKKLIRIVLYGPAISQSDCRKAGPYQLTSNNVQYEKCSDKKFLQIRSLRINKITRKLSNLY